MLYFTSSLSKSKSMTQEKYLSVCGVDYTLSPKAGFSVADPHKILSCFHALQVASHQWPRTCQSLCIIEKSFSAWTTLFKTESFCGSSLAINLMLLVSWKCFQMGLGLLLLMMRKAKGLQMSQIVKFSVMMIHVLHLALLSLNLG